MDLKLNLSELKTPQDILKLTSTISLLADELDAIITTSAPNGNISAREGRRCIYKNGANYEVWVNVDGGTTWQQIDAGISIPLTYIDTDGVLAANSDIKVASQKATKTYVDTKVPVPLTTAKGGTGSTANANAASGVVVLNASSQLPAVDGSLLTGLSTVTQVNDVETTGVVLDYEAPLDETTVLSVAKTITSGKTVLLIASGYANMQGYGQAIPTVTIRLKQDSTVVQTILLLNETIANAKVSWACCGVVTGLSGAITFSVTGQSDTLTFQQTVYGNLCVLEF